MVVVIMASLDQAIVATALPDMVTDLGGFTSYSWVFTAFLLCQTVSIPIYGKLGDIYGRRIVLIAAIGIFLLGSMCCGLAGSMAELAIFRGLQGLGAGGLIPLAHATVGELIPPRSRVRFQALISAGFAIGSVLGPAAGGLIVDNMSWRWIFYVNVPIGAAALILIGATMPRLPTQAERKPIDFLGGALLMAGTALFLLGLVWGGSTYPWGSIEVLGSIGLSVALLCVFVVVERRAVEPLLPFVLLRQPSVATGAISIALCALCMFGTIAYVPLFAQGVVGTSASSSGIVLAPFMLGGVAASIIGGQLMARTGRYRRNALVGPLVLGAGMALLWRMGVTTSAGEVARNTAVAGLGLGTMMLVFVVSTQNVVAMNVIGSATALLQFTRAIGTTVGVTIFGIIVNHGFAGAQHSGLAVSHRLPPVVRAQLTSALHPAFLLGVGVCIVLFLVVLVGLEDRPLRTSFHSERGRFDEEGGVAGEAGNSEALIG